jgi:hypothetical protein
MSKKKGYRIALKHKQIKAGDDWPFINENKHDIVHTQQDIYFGQASLDVWYTELEWLDE